MWALNGTGKDFGKLVRTLTGHGHRINTLALSTDYVMRSGPYDHMGRLYKAHTDPLEAAKEKIEAFKGKTGRQAHGAGDGLGRGGGTARVDGCVGVVGAWGGWVVVVAQPCRAVSGWCLARTTTRSSSGTPSTARSPSSA